MNDHPSISSEAPTASRREFVRKSLYVAPAILSLAAAPAFAKAGSGKPGKPDKEDKPDREDKQDKGDKQDNAEQRGKQD